MLARHDSECVDDGGRTHARNVPQLFGEPAAGNIQVILCHAWFLARSGRDWGEDAVDQLGDRQRAVEAQHRTRQGLQPCLVTRQAAALPRAVVVMRGPLHEFRINETATRLAIAQPVQTDLGRNVQEDDEVEQRGDLVRPGITATAQHPGVTRQEHFLHQANAVKDIARLLEGWIGGQPVVVVGIVVRYCQRIRHCATERGDAGAGGTGDVDATAWHVWCL